MRKIKYLLLILSIMLTSTAHTILKLGAKYNDIDNYSFINIIITFIKSPIYILGFAFFAVASFLWAYCLSKFELNYANYIASLQYVFIAISSVLILGEKISSGRWVGCFIIIIGVIVSIKY